MKRWIACCCLLLPWTASAAGEPLWKASLALLWVPQAQFAGYYMAQEKGIYQKHGIDLSIIEGGADRTPAEYLRDGRADFAVLWLTTALQRRSEGLPLMNLAQIVQQSSLLLVTRKSSGIERFSDLDGRKVGLWGGDLDIPPRSAFDRKGIRVKRVAQSETINLFLRGGVEATSAMWYNEYHTILNAGINPEELRVFALKDHGANFPEDGLYALRKTVEANPQRVNAFVQASLAGWDYAFAHPEETLDVMLRIMKEARLPANRMHQRWMLARMQDLLRPDAGQGMPGTLNREAYRFVTGYLQQTGLIRNATDYDDFVKAGRALP